MNLEWKESWWKTASSRSYLVMPYFLDQLESFILDNSILQLVSVPPTFAQFFA